MKVAVGLGPVVTSLGGVGLNLGRGFDLVGDCIRMLLLAHYSNRGCSVRRGVG